MRIPYQHPAVAVQRDIFVLDIRQNVVNQLRIYVKGENMILTKR